uniref:ATP synthase complex subunit 8 n=1 Tax=Stenomorpha consobrina TaxID=2841702 RepID=A0A8F3JBM1_9CUCU|nr:ATP synthase F0 subunit 8 [Stenomorpha consobrina]
MPQMAPLSWLTLMMFFIMLFLMLNIMNYFSFTHIIKPKKTSSISKFKINWKW